MKQNRSLILGIAGCLLVALIGYFWATALMGSVFGYRSPLRFTPPAPAAPLGTSLTHRVVIVLIDALRYDTSINNNVMPFLNRLRDLGASAKMHSLPPSYSEPGYTTILTGSWPDINDGPAVNLDYADIPIFTQDDIFSAAHRLGLRTAISGYDWFEKLVPQTALDASFYTSGEDAAADQSVVQAALPMLSDNFQLLLIHLDQVDYAGHHQGGPLDPRWNAAAKRVDGELQQIVAALDLNQDTVIVLSDHGMINRGGHGGPEPVTLLEPFVMVGAGVHPGPLYPDVAQVDVAPTIAALLGTNLPASSEGLVQTAMLTLSPAYETKIQAAEIAQKALLFKSYTVAIKSQPTRPPDPNNPFSYVIAIDSARANRLAHERVWRNVAAIALAVLPVYFLVITGKKGLFWLFGGALIYVLVFNFRYAVLDGRTYSLSSVDSQTWLITYTAITALIALIIGWLVYMLRLRLFSAGSRKAAKSTLGFLFFTIYLLALPILVSFAVNGLVVTWTLPEFYTSYIALLSLIQWIFVAAFGLLLAGAAALIAHYVPQTTIINKKYRRKYGH
ncbi:MAG: alkaline phosphatase family protein [Anaerolineales bacterium]